MPHLPIRHDWEALLYRHYQPLRNGDVFEKKSPDIFEKVRRFRFNLVAGTRDKGYPLHMSWMGTAPKLRYTVIGRLAFAIGLGGVGLQASLSRFEQCQAELEITDFFKDGGVLEG